MINRSIPISNAHIHTFWNTPLEKRETLLKELMEKLNYDTVTTLSIPYNTQRITRCRDFTENLIAFYLKAKMPGRVYAYAGLTPTYIKENNTPEFFLEQLKFYLAAGFDGLKMIEGRPNQRPVCGPFNDPKYQLVYQYCEENQIPIVVHANAADVCWKPGGSFEKKGMTHITWMDYYNDLKDVLKAYPKLRMTIAHFGFSSLHPEEAAALLDEFPNVYYDICPNQYMFPNFAANEKVWRPFFEKYQDRIIYGTDLGSNTKDLDGSEALELDHMVRGFLEEDEFFYSLGHPIPPMRITDETILRKIYKENMMAFYQQKAPLPVNPAVMRKEFDIVMDTYYTFLTRQDIENMKLIETVL